jgi:hypothetical protein
MSSSKAAMQDGSGAQKVGSLNCEKTWIAISVAPGATPL